MTIVPLTLSPSGVSQAYAKVAGAGSAPEAAPGTGFGAALGRAMQGVIDSGHAADSQAMTAINGGGNFTEVATAVSHAELSLQTAVAIRDKVVQAYQDIMRMPI